MWLDGIRWVGELEELAGGLEEHLGELLLMKMYATVLLFVWCDWWVGLHTPRGKWGTHYLH